MSRHLWNEKLGRWVWRCDVCGTTELWSESWSWFGSWLDADAGGAFSVCSEECRLKAPGGFVRFASWEKKP